MNPVLLQEKQGIVPEAVRYIRLHRAFEYQVLDVVITAGRFDDEMHGFRHPKGGDAGKAARFTYFQEYLISVFLFPHRKRSISKIYRS